MSAPREGEDRLRLPFGRWHFSLVDRCGGQPPLYRFILRLQLLRARQGHGQIVSIFDHLAKVPVGVGRVRPPLDAIEVEEDASARDSAAGSSSGLSITWPRCQWA